MGLVIVWICFGFAAGITGSNRGGSQASWFFCGLLLGPIGWGLAFTAGRQCGKCRKKIHLQAVICPYCGDERVRPAISEMPVKKKAGWEDRIGLIFGGMVIVIILVSWAINY